MQVELSTIFLSIMWLMRETGNTKGRGKPSPRAHIHIAGGQPIMTSRVVVREGFKLNMALFAISFFATRILAMPAYLRKARALTLTRTLTLTESLNPSWAPTQVWHEEGFRALGHVRYAFVGLCGLNLFWFVKILKMAKAQTAAGVAATAIAGGAATAVSL